MIKKIIIVLLLAIILPLTAQNKKDKVLMTIENEDVHVSEFLHVYNKNKDVVSEENKKNISEYLDLFINYKLKLHQAFDLKLDTVPSYLKEFNKYKKQLIQPYLKDRKVSDQLVKQAYDRMKEEINASHILITLPAHASPKDTLQAFNTLMEARNKILNGKDFETIAKQYSKDPSVKDNGGKLGYFTAFSMLYPFENAAYATKIGSISKPFTTQYGYHIVKVNEKRVSKGEIKAAHIMIKKDDKNPTFAKTQIDDIYNKLKQGETFEFLAQKYSDDKSSAKKGGVLRRFSQSKMVQPFGDIAFSLKNIGDVSKPFETKFGWHFVKLIKKFPIENYDKLKEELIKKVEKGDRSILVGNSIAEKLKKKYDIVINKKVLDELLNAPKNTSVKNKTFLTIENVNYTTDDLEKYFKDNLRKNHQDFVNEKVINYYKDNLEKSNPEYASTLKEYRDGLLLFDLLQKKIWTKAENDTIGLQNFFDKNVANYTWKERVKVEIASCTKLEKAKLVKQYLEEGKSITKIKELVNEGATIHVLFNEGTYEIDSKKLPTNFVAKKGVSNIITEDDKHFAIIKVLDLLPTTQKKLNDTKGKVISDYQDYLEKQWIVDLKKTYKVKVNKKNLKKLVKKYK